MSLFTTLTDAERDQLAAKLTSGAVQLAREYSTLDYAPPIARESYPMPREGIIGWLNSASETLFVLAEVTTGTDPRPERWL